MIIRPPNQSDWEIFAALAGLENWLVPRSELQLYQGPWAHRVHVHDDDGFCGLVTTAVYDKSAWIGNLIVPRSRRGQGCGSRLFQSVLADLLARGPASIWLTASDQGKGIYARQGFVEVDRIERWLLPASGTRVDLAAGGEAPHDSLLEADHLAWNERRDALLSEICARGKVFAVDSAVALLQPGQDLQVVGPWYTGQTPLQTHRELLNRLLAAADPDLPLVADLFASSPLPGVCAAAGLQCIGRTSLMAYGDSGPVNLQSMVSLASLGSMG